MKILYTNDDSLLVDLPFAFVYLNCIGSTGSQFQGHVMAKADAFTLQLSAKAAEKLFNLETDPESFEALATALYCMFILDRNEAGYAEIKDLL